ncbi:MAG TPA: hypothetical protein VFM18_12605 [Methanosarcina sp.]|nr:hypothetical protein [Methanosarcina sp.]
MAVFIYNEFEHPAGFVGIRVARRVGDKFRQKYFAFSKLTKGKNGEISAKQLKALENEARALDEAWRLENEKYKRQALLSRPNANTRKEHALPVTGITANIKIEKKNGKPLFYPCFFVKKPGEGQASIGFRVSKYGYEGAWNGAVDYFSGIHELSPKQKRELLNKLPDPKQFIEVAKAKRKYGYNITVKDLRKVGLPI